MTDPPHSPDDARRTVSQHPGESDAEILDRAVVLADFMLRLAQFSGGAHAPDAGRLRMHRSLWLHSATRPVPARLHVLWAYSFLVTAGSELFTQSLHQLAGSERIIREAEIIPAVREQIMAELTDRRTLWSDAHSRLTQLELEMGLPSGRPWTTVPYPLPPADAFTSAISYLDRAMDRPSNGME